MSVLLGLLCAVGSAIFNGSFAVLFKTPQMQELQIHPMTFQLYVCLGIFVSSLLAATVADQVQFTGWGILAGALFVGAVSASFAAIDDIGVALAQGIWGGGAMVVSYLWGTLVFQETPRHVALSVSGLFLLVLGVLGIAFCERIARQWKKQHLSSSHYSPIPLASQEGDARSSDPPVLEAGNNSKTSVSPQKYARGVFWACTVGLFGGSILAPMHYVPPGKQGLVFLPSFGLGCLLVSPTVFGIYALVNGSGSPPLHLRQALVTGLLSGLIWNLGNLLSIWAIPILTYGVAYPIMQCAILVSGVWGIYVFQEITDSPTIQVFWIGGATLVLGGAVLAVSQ